MSKYKDGITGKERYGKAVSKPRTAADGVYRRSKELPFIETNKDATEKKDAIVAQLEKINTTALVTVMKINKIQLELNGIYTTVKEAEKRRKRREEILQWVGLFLKFVIITVLATYFLVSLCMILITEGI